MRTPQEILLEQKSAQLRRDVDEKRKAAMLAECRVAVWPWLIGVIGWPLVIGAILAVELQGRVKPIMALPAVMLMLSIGQLIAAYKRRERGWQKGVERARSDSHDQARVKSLSHSIAFEPPERCRRLPSGA